MASKPIGGVALSFSDFEAAIRSGNSAARQFSKIGHGRCGSYSGSILLLSTADLMSVEHYKPAAVWATIA